MYIYMYTYTYIYTYIYIYIYMYMLARRPERRFDPNLCASSCQALTVQSGRNLRIRSSEALTEAES